jgi:23S rRNA (guanosine2251-2'-O)-methyltransferase
MQYPKDNFIFGLRPVIEAIESGKEFEKVFLQTNLTSPVAKELQRLLRENNILYQYVPLEKLRRITPKNHQGVVAYVSEIAYHKIEDILPFLFEKGKNPLILILDEITDVRNMGAIVRTAECAGADAVVIPQKGSALINAEGMKASAGALNILPVCREKNLVDTVHFMQSSGVQVLACDEKAELSYTRVDLTVPTAFILGSEGKGISSELLRLSDKQVKIPLLGKIDSLNVSVSAGIVLFESLRQRMVNVTDK